MLSFPLITCQSDARADFGARFVSFEKDRVCVERIYAGIWMRLTIPFRHFSDVLLASSPSGILRLSLIHRDPDLCLLLNESNEERDVLAHFSEVARRLSLPRYVEGEEGQRHCLDLCLGGILRGRVPGVRRRGAIAIRRRPRFLVRRRMGERRLMKPLLK
jgi:hypothetical protein